MDLLGEGKRLQGSRLAVWLVALKVMVLPFTKRGNTGEDSCLGTGEKLDSVRERMTWRARDHVKQAGGCMDRFRIQRSTGNTNLKVDKVTKKRV